MKSLIGSLVYNAAGKRGRIASIDEQRQIVSIDFEGVGLCAFTPQALTGIEVVTISRGRLPLAEALKPAAVVTSSTVSTLLAEVANIFGPVLNEKAAGGKSLLPALVQKRKEKLQAKAKKKAAAGTAKKPTAKKPLKKKKKAKKSSSAMNPFKHKAKLGPGPNVEFGTRTVKQTGEWDCKCGNYLCYCNTKDGRSKRVEINKGYKKKYNKRYRAWMKEKAAKVGAKKKAKKAA